ncbi:hypothetical protein FRC10_003057 [Ceratobasidium sp. 414]|nr:hypothetical protein FRC10_003057 [Ceratobasidium sp. 414]
MVPDSIKREDDPPVQDPSGDISTLSAGALSLKQDSTDAPIKEVKETSTIVPRTVILRRRKPKGDTFTPDQLVGLLLPYNKFFLAKHDDGRLEIYCWATPGFDLGHLYHVNPIDGALTGSTNATQAFTIGSSTYEPDIQNQALYMRTPSGHQPVRFYLDFQCAQDHHLNLTLPTVAVLRDFPGRDPADSISGIEPSHIPHSASSQQETPTTGANASALGTSSARGEFGIPDSDLTSTPMILRVPKNVNPEDPNASERLKKYAEMFKRVYNKRGDKTLKLQTVLRPSSLARHLGPHCGVKGYTCDRCGKKCNTQQQLDRHKTNNHGVPKPKPKLAKRKVVKNKGKVAKR